MIFKRLEEGFGEEGKGKEVRYLMSGSNNAKTTAIKLVTRNESQNC